METSSSSGVQQQQQQQHSAEPEISYLRKLWLYRKYFVIEPLVFCWLLPSCLHLIAVQNLGLEKACHVNLGYSKDICINVIDKTLTGINCDELIIPDDDVNSSNSSSVSNELSFAFNSGSVGTDINSNLSANFNLTVCKAERDTQKKVTFINGIRGPMASIFPIIVILFAGGWSDRKGLRKPCMLFPMIGEVLSATALLISSIFMETIPMEFGSILERVLPAMFGGQTLMIMGIFSYMSSSTEEKDRTFRFGIFAVFANIVPIIGIPFSGTLFKHLGYVNVFILSDAILILGILYLIFFVDEVKITEKNSTLVEGQENPAFELSENERNVENGSGGVKQSHQNAKDTTKSGIKNPPKKNCLTEFFDPTLAYDCLKVFFMKRERNGRLYLILLVISYFLFIGPTQGELDYLYQFTLIALNWDGEQFSVYSTYSTVIVTVGTFLITGVFSKIFNMSDSMVGLISSICTSISRPMFAFSKQSVLYYAATTIDMFVSAKAIAIKALISSFVAIEELGRVYAVMGIMDAFGGFIFPPIYSYIYSSTIDTFPGAFYLFGDIFFVPTAFIFALTYYLLRNKSNKETHKEAAEGQDNPNNKEILESTYM